MDRNGQERKDLPVRKGGRLFPALCKILGVLILLSAFALLIPTSLPRMLGYELYEVVSASMAPEIPVGSLLFVKPAEPSEVKAGEIIAYRSGQGGEGAESVVTHRVEQNRQAEGEFVTKGDANELADMAPVPYDSLIGRVTLHIPVAGSFMSLLSGTVGKVYMALYLICGLIFFELGSRLGRGEEASGKRQRDKEI